MIAVEMASPVARCGTASVPPYAVIEGLTARQHETFY
jgi:hypothetical protein